MYTTDSLVFFTILAIIGVVLAVGKVQYEKHPEWFPKDK
jgi:predicted membrane channel-forming protein YqfA (hemolysin III family)